MKLTFAILKICVADILQAVRDWFVFLWRTSRIGTVVLMMNALSIIVNLLMVRLDLVLINLFAVFILWLVVFEKD